MPTPRVVSKEDGSEMPRRQPHPLKDGRHQGRHALTTRPDVTTGTTRRHPRLHVDVSSLVSTSKPKMDCHANPFQLAVPSRYDLARKHRISSSSPLINFIYKPHLSMSLALSLYSLPIDRTSIHLSVILDLSEGTLCNHSIGVLHLQ
jgi:hypothetical protein